MTSDEPRPAEVYPLPGTKRFYYPGEPVTQYWLRPGPAPRRGLRLRVNGRAQYWHSRQNVPGGMAFENFELREPYRRRQRYIFGVTRRAPAELGFSRAE
jgi:hypothetical protein